MGSCEFHESTTRCVEEYSIVFLKYSLLLALLPRNRLFWINLDKDKSYPNSDLVVKSGMSILDF